jgi:4-hydroxy-4-methyl-2-oxoglutarate aldolase
MNNEAILEAVAGLDTATVYESNGKRGALPPQIKPIAPEFRIAGFASTVEGPPGDNLWLHHAIAAAERGTVLVAGVRGAYDHGYWGEIMSTAARERGLAGLVIDGCVRDGALLASVGLPVFARGLCIKGTTKRVDGVGMLNSLLSIGDVIVRPGDFILGDCDGVVVVASGDLNAALAQAHARVEQERTIVTRLKNGETTLQVYNLPPVPRGPMVPGQT